MTKIAVIGAGIIGSTIATRLLLDGHAVTVYEPEPQGFPTSSGNAGLIALPENAPIASAGILSTVPRWLMDPLGPLTVRWQDVPALSPWLLRFLAAATPAREASARSALSSLLRSALVDHQRLGHAAGLTDYLRETGYLSIYDTEASLAAALREAENVRAALGFEAHAMTPAAARALEPRLEGAFVGAVHQPTYWAVTNPLTVLRAYQTFVWSRCTLVAERVVRLSQTTDAILVHAASGQNAFDRVVVAAGIWSRELVLGLGARVLLETERGYNTTFTELGWNLALPIGFADHGFIATPLVDGLRVGGAVELARPDTAPNFARAKAMRTKMRRYVPSLPEGGTEWMGRRPSTPDSVPVISLHPGDERIIHAFGHGHLGLTLSAVTARLVAELISETASSIDMAGFSLARFQRGGPSGQTQSRLYSNAAREL